MSKSSSTIIAETIGEVEDSMTEFKEGLEAALKKKAESAEYAETADTLEGKTPAEVEALLLAEVTKHTSALGQNVHGLNAGMVGSYNKSEYDAKFDLMLDTDSGIPLDFYGDREFLPPSVTGSFESGSNTTPYSNVAMMMEDNGTLMILRPGTDGDSAGVYYSYLRNAMTETDLAKNLVMSNVEYRPAYFPDGMRAKCILKGTQDIITGIMKDATTGAHTGYFISLTNNTMDQTKHTGIFVPNGNFLSVRGPLPGLYHTPFGFIKGNYVYILHDIHQEGKIGYRVWRLNKNELITGNFTSATQIKGWTINRGQNGVVTRDDIVIYDDVVSSTINTGIPSTTVLATNGSTMATALTRDNGETGIMGSWYMQFYPSDNIFSVASAQAYFSFEFNENKQIDVSKYHNDPIRMDYSSAGWALQASAAMNQNTYNSHHRQQNSQSTDSIYANVYNQLWLWTVVSYTAGTGSMYLHRFQYDPSIDPVAVLAGDANWTEHGYVSPVGRFGSALTASMRAVSNVGDGVVNCLNFGRLPEPYGATSYYVRCALIGEPTFQYSSVTGNFAWKGFGPTDQRYDQIALNQPATNWHILLNEGSPGASRTSQARFTRAQPTLTTRAAVVNADMSVSGSVTVPQAVMETLEAQILTNLASRGYTPSTDPIAGSYSKYHFELNIPQIYTDMPPFVVGSIMSGNGANRAIHMFIYTVTISGSRQNVTGASIQPGTALLIRNEATVGSALGVLEARDCGQTAIRRVSGGFMIGFADSVSYHVVGNGGRAMLALRYSGGTWAVNGNVYWDYWNGTAPAGWVNLPSRGLYYVLSSEFIYSEIDCGTKMIATLFADNSMSTLNVNELRARSVDPAYGFVMMSQRVVSAWTVYFADETPAMLDGYYSLVQPLNYALNPATDANKTFYVWLVRSGAALTYAVTTTNQPPSSPSLYLGYFTTTNTGLNLIDVRKRVAVDGKMLSPDARGSSIPLTSGTPNSYGRLNWK